MSVYKLFGAGTGGTQESVASLDVQFDGRITAIHGSANADMDADGESFQCEASFLSSTTIAVNDSRGSLFIMQAQMSLTTSGVMNGSLNSGVSGLNIPVAAGERIHLHLGGASGVTSSTNIYLYVDDDAPAALRRRR